MDVAGLGTIEEVAIDLGAVSGGVVALGERVQLVGLACGGELEEVRDALAALELVRVSLEPRAERPGVVRVDRSDQPCLRARSSYRPRARDAMFANTGAATLPPAPVTPSTPTSTTNRGASAGTMPTKLA